MKHQTGHHRGRRKSCALWKEGALSSILKRVKGTLIQAKEVCIRKGKTFLLCFLRATFQGSCVRRKGKKSLDDWLVLKVFNQEGKRFYSYLPKRSFLLRWNRSDLLGRKKRGEGPHGSSAGVGREKECDNVARKDTSSAEKEGTYFQLGGKGDVRKPGNWGGGGLFQRRGIHLLGSRQKGRKRIWGGDKMER